MKSHLGINILVILVCINYNVQAQSLVDSIQNRIVPFGTKIDPEIQTQKSQQLAKSISLSHASQWQATGDQLRKYYFKEAEAEMPYRVYVPTTWDGESKLSMVMFLHGAWNDESSYLDQNDKQMLKLAEKHGFLLVSPLGHSKLGAYGTCLMLPAVFGQPKEAAKIMMKRTEEKEHSLELSEIDVINVLELVLNEYPIDQTSIFLTGHSMGSGGTLYLGAKYNYYWKALAPMSGPFVAENLYPWERLREIPVFLSEGIRSMASLEGSRQMAKWMEKQGYKIKYKEVDANHGGMVPLILPTVFDFFNQLSN